MKDDYCTKIACQVKYPNGKSKWIYLKGARDSDIDDYVSMFKTILYSIGFSNETIESAFCADDNPTCYLKNDDNSIP